MFRQGVCRINIGIVSLVLCAMLPRLSGASTPAPPSTPPAPEASTWSAQIRLRLFPSATASHWEQSVEGSSYGSLEEATSDFALAHGAELDLFLRRLVVRGFYEQGQYVFADRGEADRTTTVFAIGLRNEKSLNHHGFLGLSLHRIEERRTYRETFANDNHRLTYEELFVEVFGGSKPLKRGFVFETGVGTSIRGLPNLFRGEGKYEHFGISLVFSVGVRPGSLPLAMTLGGELHGYQFEYDMIPDPGPSFADILGRAKIDTTYGVVFKISYGIGQR